MNARRLTLATPACLCALVVLLACALQGAVGAAPAGAFATVAPAPVVGSSGLPDGRVYEEVSPPNKHGNAAAPPVNYEAPAMFAEAGGEGVAYTVNGAAIGNTLSGLQRFIVAKRGAEGWVNAGAQPRAIGEQNLIADNPAEVGFSADLNKVFFGSQAQYLAEAPTSAPLVYDIANGSIGWLDPPPATSEENDKRPSIHNIEAVVAGFSSDMSTFYLKTETGFYEWHDGVLSVAGVLPDRSVDPHAQAAGRPFARVEGGQLDLESQLRNQVSTDGSRAFFVSSTGGTPELYVRETDAGGVQSTVLVSRDTLLPSVNGLPAPAPAGVEELAIPDYKQEEGGNESYPSFVYASPDGSRAFFASASQLTSDAPAGGGMYEFNTDTNVLTYLPGVGAAPILTSSQDGTRFLFDSPAGGLSVWSETGSSGGTVVPIEPLSISGEAWATPDGSVFVFESAAPLAGFNNGGSHIRRAGFGLNRNQEIYRYDMAENSLSCVSCPPTGIVPTGDAYISHATSNPNSTILGPMLFRPRGVSTDGSRIVFDTPDPLVPQDTNARPPSNAFGGDTFFENGRDVYEWENGKIFLISTGTSSENSFVGDESANGDDVFFSTAQGLAPGDTDGGYDVYDARVPRPGDRPPPSPVACEGDVCQGPPSVPSLLGTPASATFDGLGNPSPPPPSTPAKKTTIKKAAKCKKGFVRKKSKCVKNARPKKAKAKRSTHGKGGN
jgi:hypothetical protein